MFGCRVQRSDGGLFEAPSALSLSPHLTGQQGEKVKQFVRLPVTPSSHPHTLTLLRHKLPSTHPSWSRVKSTVKLHLPDLLSLLDTLRDPSMQASVLKHVLSLSEYFVCFPRLLKPLNRVLVEAWSREGGGGRGGGERGVQVLAFLCLRRTILLQPHPALHGVLKVRGCG